MMMIVWFFREYFPSDRYVSYDAALKNISMVLLNSHFTQGSVRPYVPAMVEVGGITVKPTPDQLPNVRVQKFIFQLLFFKNFFNSFRTFNNS